MNGINPANNFKKTFTEGFGRTTYIVEDTETGKGANNSRRFIVLKTKKSLNGENKYETSNNSIYAKSPEEALKLFKKAVKK